MRSIRFAVLSNARKYVTERVVKNGRNDLVSVSLGAGATRICLRKSLQTVQRLRDTIQR